MPITDSGAIDGAGDGAGSEAGMLTGTISIGARGGGSRGASRAGKAGEAAWATCPAPAANAPLLTRKLRNLPCRVHDTSWLPVMRHQAGRSPSTEVSVERISSNWPRSSGSICLRISSNRPLPQSRSPPSKLTAGAWV